MKPLYTIIEEDDFHPGEVDKIHEFQDASRNKLVAFTSLESAIKFCNIINYSPPHFKPIRVNEEVSKKYYEGNMPTIQFEFEREWRGWEHRTGLYKGIFMGLITGISIMLGIKYLKK